VFLSVRVAVEVRGCFWHACSLHRTIPSANHQWWAEKLAHNRRRDAETEGIWRAGGWEVVIVWEHDNLEEAADKIATLIRDRTSS
jgi:DNA mismatch endonuclease Vsr